MEKIKKISNKLFIKKSIWIFIFLAFYNNVFTQVELESYINLATEKNENLKFIERFNIVEIHISQHNQEKNIKDRVSVSLKEFNNSLLELLSKK